MKKSSLIARAACIGLVSFSLAGALFAEDGLLGSVNLEFGRGSNLFGIWSDTLVRQIFTVNAANARVGIGGGIQADRAIPDYQRLKQGFAS